MLKNEVYFLKKFDVNQERLIKKGVKILGGMKNSKILRTSFVKASNYQDINFQRTRDIPCD